MPNDCAILVGISRYADSGFPKLDGPPHDVELMKAWLLDPDGGGLDKANVRIVESMDPLPDAPPLSTPPTSHHFLTSFFSLVFDQAGKPIPRKDSRLYLYFSGHGYGKKGEGGFLVCQDTKPENPEGGYRMNSLLDEFYRSSIPEIVVILDCCHSGFLGDVDFFDQESTNIRKGVTLLSASRYNELAVERYGQGVFTKILCEGLQGGAVDKWGNVTAANLYALAERSLSPWEQRPTFRTFVSQIRAIRECLI